MINIKIIFFLLIIYFHVNDVVAADRKQSHDARSSVADSSSSNMNAGIWSCSDHIREYVSMECYKRLDWNTIIKIFPDSKRQNILNKRWDNVAFLFHDYMESSESVYAKVMRKTFILSTHQPFCTFNYEKLTNQTYNDTLKDLDQIAKCILPFVQQIEKLGASPQRFCFIGMGIGAHLAGNVASYLKKTNRQVAMIIGLDPQTNYYGDITNYDGIHHLSPNDANWVQCMHTDLNNDVDTYRCGHQDFYPYGGITQQPCCNSLTTSLTHLCNHKMASNYLILSINNEIMATYCETYVSFLNRSCLNFTDIFGIYNLQRQMGLFYFDTYDTKWGCPDDRKTDALTLYNYNSETGRAMDVSNLTDSARKGVFDNGIFDKLINETKVLDSGIQDTIFLASSSTNNVSHGINDIIQRPNGTMYTLDVFSIIIEDIIRESQEDDTTIKYSDILENDVNTNGSIIQSDTDFTIQYDDNVYITSESTIDSGLEINDTINESLIETTKFLDANRMESSDSTDANSSTSGIRSVSASMAIHSPDLLFLNGLLDKSISMTHGNQTLEIGLDNNSYIKLTDSILISVFIYDPKVNGKIDGSPEFSMEGQEESITNQEHSMEDEDHEFSESGTIAAEVLKEAHVLSIVAEHSHYQQPNYVEEVSTISLVNDDNVEHAMDSTIEEFDTNNTILTGLSEHRITNSLNVISDFSKSVTVDYSKEYENNYLASIVLAQELPSIVPIIDNFENQEDSRTPSSDDSTDLDNITETALNTFSITNIIKMNSTFVTTTYSQSSSTASEIHDNSVSVTGRVSNASEITESNPSFENYVNESPDGLGITPETTTQQTVTNFDDSSTLLPSSTTDQSRQEDKKIVNSCNCKDETAATKKSTEEILSGTDTQPEFGILYFNQPVARLLFRILESISKEIKDEIAGGGSGGGGDGGDDESNCVGRTN